MSVSKKIKGFFSSVFAVQSEQKSATEKKSDRKKKGKRSGRERSKTPPGNKKRKSRQNSVEEKTVEPTIYLPEAVSQSYFAEKFTDVAFIVGEGEEQRRLEAHKLVLALSSPCFKAMLFPVAFPDDTEQDTELPEEKENCLEVMLPFVDPDMFGLLLQCIYTDNVVVTPENVGPLLDMAKKYQVEKMQALCAEYLSSRLNLDFAMLLFELAPESLGDANFGLQYLQENARDVLEHKQFCEFRKERIIHFLKSEQMDCDEIDIFKAVIVWAHHIVAKQGLPQTVDNTRVALADILPLIRFPVMSVEELLNIVKPTNILTDESLLLIINYKSLEDERLRNKIALPYLMEPRTLFYVSGSSFLLKAYFDAIRHGVLGFSDDLYKMILCYRASRDGFTPQNFVARVQERKPTLIIAKVKNVQMILGGFNTCSWSDSSSSKNPNNCLFAYDIKTRQLLHFKSTGKSKNFADSKKVCFGKDDMQFNSPFNESRSKISTGFTCYEDNQTFKDYFVRNKTFALEDLECYNISGLNV